MKGIQQNAVKWIASLLLTLAAFFSGCQREDVLSFPPQEIVTRQIHEIKFLKSDISGLNKTFLVQKQIRSAEGGMVIAGDDVSGKSILFFPSDALPQDTDIIFQVDADKKRAYLDPHGLVFKKPVLLRLSYQGAILRDINEADLRIWYYNEAKDIWELVGGTVNQKEKYVEGYLEHFSLYALGAE